MNVEVLQWPAEAQRLAELREMRIPRLLVVSNGDGEVPLPTDCLEDWVAVGAPEWEVDARRHALVQRSGQHAVMPLLDGDGLLHYRDAWVSLSPVEVRSCEWLVDVFMTS